MTQLERDVRAEWRTLRRDNAPRLDAVSFKFNGRFTRRLGVCRYLGGMPSCVELASSLVASEVTMTQAFDTLRHEVAHALAGSKAGHGPQWKAWCRALGANPQRLAYLSHDENEAIEATRLPPKWSLTCTECGLQATRRSVKRDLLVGGADHTGCGGRIVFTNNRTGQSYSVAKRDEIDWNNPFRW